MIASQKCLTSPSSRLGPFGPVGLGRKDRRMGCERGRCALVPAPSDRQCRVTIFDRPAALERIPSPVVGKPRRPVRGIAGLLLVAVPLVAGIGDLSGDHLKRGEQGVVPCRM